MAKVVGFIPARSGSKGLIGKNIKALNGKPLLAYTVEAALASKVFDTLVVSSDDDEILEVARNYGAAVDKRPNNLAADESLIADVLADYIARAKLSEKTTIVLLQPTSPLRTAAHIEEALTWFQENVCDGLVSVKQLDSNVLYAYVQDQAYLAPISPLRDEFPRRQELPNVYIPNGALYIFSVAAFNAQDGIPKTKLVPFVMSEVESVDIDTEEDMRLCSHYLMNKPERRKR